MLKELESRGVWFTVTGENEVTANYNGVLPDDLTEMILANKDALKAEIFSQERALKKTLQRIVERLEAVPVVYVNSRGLGQRIAFCRDGQQDRVADDMVVYCLSELKSLSDADRATWKLVNLAKQIFGGRVFGQQKG